jgi:pimeloyl-ACP methyl ester carboxylesterase
LAGKSLYIRVYRERINPSVETQDLDGYYEALSSPASRAALLATLRDAQDSRPVIADCRRVRAPTLLIWGRNDRLFPIEYGRYLSREMPHAGLEILNSSHAPHEEVPEDTARVLLDFFGGKRAGSN